MPRRKKRWPQIGVHSGLCTATTDIQKLTICKDAVSHGISPFHAGSVDCSDSCFSLHQLFHEDCKKWCRTEAERFAEHAARKHLEEGLAAQTARQLEILFQDTQNSWRNALARFQVFKSWKICLYVFRVTFKHILQALCLESNPPAPVPFMRRSWRGFADAEGSI